MGLTQGALAIFQLPINSWSALAHGNCISWG